MRIEKKKVTRRINLRRRKQRKKRVKPRELERKLAIFCRVEREASYINLFGQIFRVSDEKCKNAIEEDNRILRHFQVTSRIEVSDFFFKINQIRGEIPENSTKAYMPSHLADRFFHYLNIRELFDWQVQCLKEYPKSRNFLFSAPTSGGKSLIADIVMFRKVLLEKATCLLVFPYVSLCQEKYDSLRPICLEFNLKIENFTAENPIVWSPGIDIACVTLEKANIILNKLLVQKKEDRKTVFPHLVVLDELHFIGDLGRGIFAESLLSKILCLNMTEFCTQIVAMSATLPNIEELANWLEADFFIGSFRPIQLSHFAKFQNEVLKIDSGSCLPCRELKMNEKESLAYFCLECAVAERASLVFCTSRRLVEDTAREISKFFETRLKPSFESSVAKYVAELQKSRLSNSLKKLAHTRVGFHHAGLSREERRAVEQAYRQKVLLVLCCTTTLSAGVNLPCSRVIIQSLRHRVKSLEVDSYKFCQMSGRAGRTSYRDFGEAIVFCRTQEELKLCLEYVQKKMPPIKTTISRPNSNLERLVVEFVSCGLCETPEELVSAFRRTTFFGGIKNLENLVTLCIENSCEARHLENFPSFREDTLKATKVCEAACQAGLHPLEADFCYCELKKLTSRLLLSDFPLLYSLSALVSSRVSVNWEIFSEFLANPSKPLQELFLDIEIDHEFLRDLVANPFLQRRVEEKQELLNALQEKDENFRYLRLYTTCLLHFFVNCDNDTVYDEFVSRLCSNSISLGDVDQLRETSLVVVNQFISLCENLHNFQMSQLFLALRPKIQSFSSYSTFPLIEIETMRREDAKTLVAQNYDISDVAESKYLAEDLSCSDTTAQIYRTRALLRL